MKNLLLKIGWRFPFARMLSSDQPVILEYHGIPNWGRKGDIDSVEFERQIVWLKEHFEIISCDRLPEKRRPYERLRVMITFDDSYQNHAKVVAPILRKHQVPGLFFACSRHAVPGKYLWCSYLRALEEHFPGNGFELRGEYIDMSPGERRQSVARLRSRLLNLKPHPAAMYQIIETELPCLEDFVSRDDLRNHYMGMTSAEVCQLAFESLFTIGAHTVDHPLLTRCDPGEAYKQMFDNKVWIEQVTQKPCTAIAYPGGDYNTNILQQCSQLNFTHGYVETPRTTTVPHLEMPRLGIYSTGLDKLGFKVQWGGLMRKLRLDVG